MTIQVISKGGGHLVVVPFMVALKANTLGLVLDGLCTEVVLRRQAVVRTGFTVLTSFIVSRLNLASVYR